MPLNPVLYALIKRHFGEVEIKNPGTQMRYDYTYNPTTKRLQLVIIEAGEEYAVNCRVCGDTHKRLWINANWWYRDREHGQTWSHLIKCFNEECFADHSRRASLHAQLFYSGSSNGFSRVAPAARQVSAPPDDFVPAQELPTGFTRLRELPKNHRAVKYLRKRGFDLDEIDELYKVGYTESQEVPVHARNRIIVPAFAESRCVGWQARYVGEIDFKAEDAPPKYYTCPGMKRGRVLYNFDRARRYQTVVIVEGPTDVWRLGPMAVAVWGSTMSAQQKERILKHCGDASVVLMLDPEIMAPTTDRHNRIKLRNLLGMTEKFSGGLALVSLPSETDPGSLERKWLRQFVKEQAAEQGVQVSYSKRS